MRREIIAEFAGVRRRIPDLDQLVVRWIFKRGRDFDILTLIHLENRQLSRAGDRPLVAEYLIVPENASVESASLVEAIRLHDEIGDIGDRRPRRGGGRQRHDSCNSGYQKEERAHRINPPQPNSTIVHRESAKIATREPRYSKLKSSIVDSSMTLRITALLFLPALVIGPGLRAQPVFHDSQAPQV